MALFVHRSDSTDWLPCICLGDLDGKLQRSVMRTVPQARPAAKDSCAEACQSMVEHRRANGKD